MLAQIIASALLKFGEEFGREVRLPLRVIDFIGIVEEAPQARRVLAFERVIEFPQVILERGGREVIERVTFRRGRGALHHFAVLTLKERVERPRLAWRRSGPVELPVVVYVMGEVDRLA